MMTSVELIKKLTANTLLGSLIAHFYDHLHADRWYIRFTLQFVTTDVESISSDNTLD